VTGGPVGADPPSSLLAQALDHTCTALGGVHPAHLTAATPCTPWDLAALLAHMDDALDAFAEAASGSVAVHHDVPLATRVGSLRRKAYALAQRWTHSPGTVWVGGLEVGTSVVTLAAALEIAVHGWDVDQATGAERPLPDRLARGLLPAAAALVHPDDRPGRFAAPLPARGGPSARLLAHLGRGAVVHRRAGLAAR